MVPQKELQPRAFSIMPLVWSLGSVVGPSFGGFFAQPARQYPSLFGNSAFFQRFPYALPNLVACLFFVVSVVVATLFLHETLASRRSVPDWGLALGKRLRRALRRGPPPPHHHHQPHSHPHHNQSHSQSATSILGNRRRSSFVDGEATAPLVSNNKNRDQPKPEAPPSFNDVFTRQTVINLASYTFLAFHSVAYDQNVTVFLNYPTRDHTDAPTSLPFRFSGGFGLASGQIGTIFTLYGIACGLVQFLLYPRLVSAFGVRHCFRVCCTFHPIPTSSFLLCLRRPLLGGLSLRSLYVA